MAALLAVAYCRFGGATRRRRRLGDFWKEQMPTKQLNFANWPLYIDSEHGKTVSLELFTRPRHQGGLRSGHPGDDSFYATVEPELAAQE